MNKEKEIFKLKEKLEKAKIPFDFEEDDSNPYGGGCYELHYPDYESTAVLARNYKNDDMNYLQCQGGIYSFKEYDIKYDSEDVFIRIQVHYRAYKDFYEKRLREYHERYKKYIGEEDESNIENT